MALVYGKQNNSDWKELVKLLIEQLDRLKQTAPDKQILTGSTVQRLRALPGWDWGEEDRPQ